MLWIKFILLASLVVYASIQLGKYADGISQKTKIGGALIGGLLLAAITSLPELVTSITAVYIGNPLLSVGNILGSNAFNIMILALFDLIFLRRKYFNRITPVYLKFSFVVLIMYLFVLAAMTRMINISFLGIHFSTLVLFAGYGVYAYLLSKHEPEEDDEDVELHLTLKQILIRFAVMAVVIFVASIFLTKTADQIAYAYPQFGSSLVGALLLAIATSLPEMMSVAILVHLGNYDMAVSSIIGSNIFNFAVMGIVDVLYVQTIFSTVTNTDIVLANVGIGLMFVFTYLVYRYKQVFKYSYSIPSIVILLVYGLFWYLQL